MICVHNVPYALLHIRYIFQPQFAAAYHGSQGAAASRRKDIAPRDDDDEDTED